MESVAAPSAIRPSRFFSGGWREHAGRWLAVGVAAAALASCLATYSVIVNSSNPFGPNPDLVLFLITVDITLLLLLAAIISRRILRLWIASRHGSVGSRLQTRIVLMFGLVAVVPAVFISVFSAAFLHVGVKSWFDDRIRGAITESVAVAHGYVEEHKKNIVADALGVAGDVNRQALLLRQNPPLLRRMVQTQGALRSLSEVVIFQRTRILARTELSLALSFESSPLDLLTLEQQQRLDEGEVIVLSGSDTEQVQAFTRLDAFIDGYVMVGRFVDDTILRHVRTTEEAAEEYKRLQQRMSELQRQFTLIFAVAALLLVLLALWAGIAFAGRLVRPVSDLVQATERVKAGDLSVQVDEGPRGDELATLSRAFNRMTSQLQEQRGELVKAYRQNDARRRFSEMVLGGVSAGVVGLDGDQRMTLCNRPALRLLGMEDAGYLGQPCANAIPEMAGLLAHAQAEPETVHQEDISLERDGQTRTLHVRIAAECGTESSDRGKNAPEIAGYILTFDNITPLIVAQRQAAWAEVARRIAHEIKNPLTPIQLSAERLLRKYGGQIEDEPERFTRYLQTIIRHVGDIGAMVEEFAAFARIAKPQMEEVELAPLIRDVIFSEESAHPGIAYKVELATHTTDKNVTVIRGDARQLRQAFGNLVKNAAEAIRSQEKDGNIRVVLEDAGDAWRIRITDTGPGLPERLKDRLTEPYVTTREGGTGLGLAIAQKIIEDHGGELTLRNREDGPGAEAVVTFAALESRREV